MSQESQNHRNLLKTGEAGELPHLLGQFGRFLYEDPVQTHGVKPQTTHQKVEAIWLKNTSGGTLAEKLLTQYEAAAVGRQTDALAGADETPAGAIPAVGAGGVLANYGYWAVVRGPTTLTAGAAISAGDGIKCGADGKAAVAVPATDAEGTRIGRAVTAAAGDGNEFEAVLDIRM
jgi:hypothetical protein